MAKLFGLPEGMEPVKFTVGDDWNELTERENKLLADVQQWARDNSRSDIAGSIVTFPVADGMATYVVWETNPASLIHVPMGDGYAIPAAHIRGLRASDLREMVDSRKALDNLFGEVV